jgi:hypothetical protein
VAQFRHRFGRNDTAMPENSPDERHPRAPICRVAAGMQEANGGRLDPHHSQQSNLAAHFVRIERTLHRAVAANPLVDRRGQGPL